MSTSRLRRQSGQAIVLVAITLVVLFGMLGLAVDGGRAYVDRRELQDAVDAAVLAAGDNYELQGDLSSAAAKAATWYGLNAHIPGYGSYSGASAVCPAAFPAGSTCTSYSWAGYPGGFTFGYFKNSVNGTIFSGTAQHQVPVAFMQVLGVPPIQNYTAIAEAVVGNQWQTPALLTLGQQGCGSPGASLKIQGSVTVTVTGDVYSNGDLVDQNGSPVSVNGSIYANCNSLPSGWTYTGTLEVPGAPVLPDPAYTSPFQSMYATTSPTSPPGSAVELKPGVYPTDPQFTSSVCHFFDPGVYTFPGGYTDNGGLNSNELKPPVEPLWNSATSSLDYTQKAGVQFWSQNAVSCGADFYATAVTSTGGGGHPLKPGGQWGIEITSVREDTWNGPSGSGTYVRQSAPSMCHPLQIGLDASTKGMQVVIGNVPGATGYFVYADPNGCEANNEGNFGFMGYVPNPVTEYGNGSGCGNLNQLPGYPSNPPPPNNTSPYVNAATSGPSYGACNLGWVSSQVFDNSATNPTGYIAFNKSCSIGSCWGSGAQCPAAAYNNPGPSTTLPPNGCSPPDGEQAPVASGLANEVPVRNVTPFGDRANENQCRPQGTTTNPCAGATVTPGAVQFYFPPNACLNQQGNGATYAFSGFQYDWISIFAPGNTKPPDPPTPNSCANNNLNGNAATTFVGTVYLPTGSITINGGNRAPVAGQVIAYNALIDGSAGVAIAFNPAVAPAPPAARLIL